MKFNLYLGAGVSGPNLQLFACADCRFTETYVLESVESRVAVLDNWEWFTPESPPFR